ncbi:MAG: LytTR family transcriptional regulator DNA-binding domain-containing protein, partial [Proteobacteria bacterium]|nr:LytTR family transcriptional regulator DNA-binding domain-containing protein [Pseudomonadota bacterium]
NALINIQHIHRLKKNAQGQHELTLQHLDEKIIVSRRHLPALRKLMQNI